MVQRKLDSLLRRKDASCLQGADGFGESRVKLRAFRACICICIYIYVYIYTYIYIYMGLGVRVFSAVNYSGFRAGEV